MAKARTPLTQRKLKQLVSLLKQYQNDQMEKEEHLVVGRLNDVIKWVKEDIQ